MEIKFENLLFIELKNQLLGLKVFYDQYKY